MKAIILARVSTKDQQEGHSIDTQKWMVSGSTYENPLI